MVISGRSTVREAHTYMKGGGGTCIHEERERERERERDASCSNITCSAGERKRETSLSHTIHLHFKPASCYGLLAAWHKLHWIYF